MLHTHLLFATSNRIVKLAVHEMFSLLDMLPELGIPAIHLVNLSLRIPHARRSYHSIPLGNIEILEILTIALQILSVAVCIRWVISLQFDS
jgi:hypothetical protein